MTNCGVTCWRNKFKVCFGTKLDYGCTQIDLPWFLPTILCKPRDFYSWKVLVFSLWCSNKILTKSTFGNLKTNRIFSGSIKTNEYQWGCLSKTTATLEPKHDVRYCPYFLEIHTPAAASTFPPNRMSFPKSRIFQKLCSIPAGHDPQQQQMQIRNYRLLIPPTPVSSYPRACTKIPSGSILSKPHLAETVNFARYFKTGHSARRKKFNFFRFRLDGNSSKVNRSSSRGNNLTWQFSQSSCLCPATAREATSESQNNKNNNRDWVLGETEDIIVAGDEVGGVKFGPTEVLITDGRWAF